ncbi:MAG: ankyrin repeat domain-containing protein [Desulfovibrionales bacterium]|nr:ankyrin repeat domain-containing protein [Desulfovibrionales bacterium]
MKTVKRPYYRYIYQYCDLIIDDNVEIVSKLIKYELVSTQYYPFDDGYYITPPATAAYYGSPNCLKLLCENGAVPVPIINKNRPALDPLIAALMGGQSEAVLILLQYSHQHLIWNGGWKFLPQIMTGLALSNAAITTY